MKEIPEFKNEEEESEFWDAHSFLDFPNEVEEIEPFSLSPDLREEILSGRRRRKMRRISLRLDPYHIELIKRIAKQKSVSHQTLMRMWLVERLREEIRSS